MTANYVEFPWRVGDEEPRAIYAVVSEKGTFTHFMVGVMDTARLSYEVVTSHNVRLNKRATTSSYGQKEQLISELNRTLQLWDKNNGNLEQAITEAFGQSTSAKRVYDAVGFSATVLGPNAEMPVVIQHAIDLIKNS